MAVIRQLQTSLAEWETKILLELLIKECDRLRDVCETSDDEDAQADAGNEFMEVDGLRERLEQAAVQTFGNSVKNFSRELL